MRVRRPFRPSDRQREILRFVHRFINEHRFCPALREIVEGTSYTSTSVVHHNLATLKREGYVDYVPGKIRTVHVLQEDGDAAAN